MANPKKFNPEIANLAREKIGQFFRDRRIELGMTQGDLCRCAGLTQPQLSRFEEGEQNITVNTLAALSGCLRVEIQFITKDPESVPGFPESSKN